MGQYEHASLLVKDCCGVLGYPAAQRALRMSEHPLVIDFHAHFLEREVYERAWMHNVASGFGADGPPAPGSRAERVHKTMFDPEGSLANMDRLGVDISVLSLSTVIAGGQWAEPDLDLELNRRANDRVAELVRANSSRFVGSFSLPLQDIDRSLAELERSVDELGLRVANLPANARGLYLGNPHFHPLWQAAADRRLIVFIHPDGVGDPWFQEYSLWNSVGQPIEETKAMSSIIYEGVFDRWPELRIVIAHGGGYLPHYYGRHDRNVANRPETARNIAKLPSDYLKSFYYDSCVYEPHVLEELVDLVGAGQIVMGSDHPMGEADPVGFVERARNLDSAGAENIKGGVATRLLAHAGALSEGSLARRGR
jgi:aminocarboxymuconate-semialdehyde decarboxylase